MGVRERDWNMARTSIRMTITELSDQGHSPAAIAAATGMPVGKVYAILRAERPDRKRAARRGTSEVPAKVVALYNAGMKPKRIAAIVDCSPAYVYRILSEQALLPPPPY